MYKCVYSRASPCRTLKRWHSIPKSHMSIQSLDETLTLQKLYVSHPNTPPLKDNTSSHV